jgi:hypothetical protein
MLGQSLRLLEIRNKSRNKNVSTRRTLNGHNRYSGVLLMSFINRAAATTLVLASVALVGCAGEGGLENPFTTGSLGTQAAAPESKVDPACVSLASRIEALRKEGIADKIEKAAAKKYKMTQADLTKADQLTKANSDFQFRCSTIMPKSAALAPEPLPAPVSAPASKAKAPPKAASVAPTQTQN